MASKINWHRYETKLRHCHPILTYNDRTITHLHIKWGVALGPIVVGAGTRHLPPSPDTCPRNQPALGQTYATVVFGERRVSGEQMLTVGRGLRTTATAAVGPGKSPQSNVPANSLGPAAESRCSKQHERCVNIAEVVTL